MADPNVVSGYIQLVACVCFPVDILGLSGANGRISVALQLQKKLKLVLVSKFIDSLIF